MDERRETTPTCKVIWFDEFSIDPSFYNRVSKDPLYRDLNSIRVKSFARTIFTPAFEVFTH